MQYLLKKTVTKLTFFFSSNTLNGRGKKSRFSGKRYSQKRRSRSRFKFIHNVLHRIYLNIHWIGRLPKRLGKWLRYVRHWFRTSAKARARVFFRKFYNFPTVFKHQYFYKSEQIRLKLLPYVEYFTASPEFTPIRLGFRRFVNVLKKLFHFFWVTIPWLINCFLSVIEWFLMLFMVLALSAVVSLAFCKAISGML